MAMISTTLPKKTPIQWTKNGFLSKIDISDS